MKMSDNPTKYDVLIEQYLRSILDISVLLRLPFHCSPSHLYLSFWVCQRFFRSMGSLPAFTQSRHDTVNRFVLDPL